MKIAIIGAMKIEIEKLTALMSNKSVIEESGVFITRGVLHGVPVCIAMCDPGKVNAAVCAQTLIIKERPTEMISLGVAGGFRDLNIGEAAVAISLVQHDVDTTALGDPLGFLSGLDTVEIKTDKAVGEGLYSAAEKAGISVRYCKFATGDQFVVSSRIKQIKKDFDADVFEMEGGAIAQACYRANIPFGAVRVISDNGDAQADYEVFKFEAADKSMKIISEYLKNK